MKFEEFKSHFKNVLLIKSDYFDMIPNNLVIRNQVTQWVRKNLLIQLKRGVYILKENQNRISKFALAHILYNPSYISRGSAMSFYGLIPDVVEQVTSITTKKTYLFRNAFGVFTFSHIKKNAFNGFSHEKDEHGLDFFIAKPEKALIDYIYFNKVKTLDELFESHRLQAFENLDLEMVTEFAKKISTKYIINIVTDLNKIK